MSWRHGLWLKIRGRILAALPGELHDKLQKRIVARHIKKYLIKSHRQFPLG